jgi:hypothetical protein
MKIKGKTQSHAKIFVSKAVIQDLSWFVSHVQRSDSMYLVEDVNWDVQRADVTAYSDACMSGLGFFFFLRTLKERLPMYRPSKSTKRNYFLLGSLSRHIGYRCHYSTAILPYKSLNLQ